MKIYKAIVIGGGISGLACGNKLHKKKQDDFLLLTKDLGGRMSISKSGLVDYGASYIRQGYKNIKKYVDKIEKIKIGDCYFIGKKNFVNVYTKRNLLELPRLIKLYFILKDFEKRLSRLRKRAEKEKQKDILKSDKVLSSYVKKSAKQFIKENKLERLNDVYFNPVFHSTGFVGYEKANAFFYLDNLLSVTTKLFIADFRKTVPKLTKGWENKIKKQEVLKLNKIKKGLYKVSTLKHTYYANNVVIAIPYRDAKKIHRVPQPKQNISVYVIHIDGEREEIYKNKKVVFFKPQHHDITILWKQITGTDVIFSKILDPHLGKYYEKYKVIKKVYWDTAITLSGKKWFDQVLDDGLYLASEYNICGLEDCFIAGVYAANQIIAKK
ncbi:MAG: FAD/NAD(P)-binding protein [Candidatus Woesearchaeota archaeon]